MRYPYTSRYYTPEASKSPPKMVKYPWLALSVSRRAPSSNGLGYQVLILKTEGSNPSGVTLKPTGGEDLIVNPLLLHKPLSRVSPSP